MARAQTLTLLMAVFTALSLHAQTHASFLGSAAIRSGPATDADATAYLAALNASNYPPTAAITSAINTYVIASKASGAWATFDVVYPMIGTNLDQQGINLKNTATFHAAVGGGTVAYDTNGMTGNGANGWVNTTWLPQSGSVGATSTNMALSLYCRTQTIGDNRRYLGCLNTDNLSGLIWTANTANWTMEWGGSPPIGTTTALNGDHRQFMTVTLTNVTAVGFTNSVLASTATMSGLQKKLDRAPGFFVTSFSGGPLGAFGNMNLCYFSAGAFMTSSQASAEYTAVQAMQTTLSRANP